MELFRGSPERECWTSGELPCTNKTDESPGWYRRGSFALFFRTKPVLFPRRAGVPICRSAFLPHVRRVWWDSWRPCLFYRISCSICRNRSQWKKSSNVMLRPSQSFCSVETVTLWFRPLIMLFTVDCVTPLRVHSLLRDRFLSWHNSKIRILTAWPTSMDSFLSIKN